MGHGHELVHLTSKQVPKGCTYVTIGLSGMTSIDLPKILYAFQDDLMKDALKFPDDENIHRVLTEYFRLPFDSSIRVHNEGDIYTDTIISLWTNAGPNYFKSGIYELGRPLPAGEPLYTTHYKRDVNGRVIRDSRGIPRTITRPQDSPAHLFQFVYKDSIWKPELNDDNRIRRHYSEIMNTFRTKISFNDTPKLIFYNFSCRFPLDYANPDVITHVTHKRQQSLNEITRKGVYYQMAQPFARPNANKPPNRNITFEDGMFSQKGAMLVPYFEKWVTTWASDTDHRSRWSSMISEALDDIRTRRSPEMNTAPSASAAASAAASSTQSYDSPFRHVLGMRPATASAFPQFRPRFNTLHGNASMSSLLSAFPSMSLSSAASSAQELSENNMHNNAVVRTIGFSRGSGMYHFTAKRNRATRSIKSRSHKKENRKRKQTRKHLRKRK
jgi:hypothetical protein